MSSGCFAPIYQRSSCLLRLPPPAGCSASALPGTLAAPRATLEASEGPATQPIAQVRRLLAIGILDLRFRVVPGRDAQEALDEATPVCGGRRTTSTARCMLDPGPVPGRRSSRWEGPGEGGVEAKVGVGMQLEGDLVNRAHCLAQHVRFLVR